MSIGKNICKYRKSSNMTQEQLGMLLGVTNQAVSKWEQGVSLPDVMLIPKIACSLNISIEDIYKDSYDVNSPVITADEFPTLCFDNLVKLFYDASKIHYQHIENSLQISYIQKKISSGGRLGCVSNSKGAVIISDHFLFIDKSFKSPESYKDNILPILEFLSDNTFKKVFYYQYNATFQKSKNEDGYFTFDEIMLNCGLTKHETIDVLQKLQNIALNELYVDKESDSVFYIFKVSKAIYVHAIYNLVKLLSDDPAWIALRDTSVIDDFYFEKRI